MEIEKRKKERGKGKREKGKGKEKREKGSFGDEGEYLENCFLDWYDSYSISRFHEEWFSVDYVSIGPIPDVRTVVWLNLVMIFEYPNIYIPKIKSDYTIDFVMSL